MGLEGVTKRNTASTYSISAGSSINKRTSNAKKKRLPENSEKQFPLFSNFGQNFFNEHLVKLDHSFHLIIVRYVCQLG
jgi:hypothetical protein